MCLKCAKFCVCDEPRHWKLCMGCYNKMFGLCNIAEEFSYAEIDAYKKKFWSIYKEYPIDNILKEKFTMKGIALGLRPPANDPVIKNGTDPRGHKGLDKRIEKFLQAKCIKKAIYTYEWKWDDDMPYGLHAHLILIGDIKHINQHINRQKEKWFNLNPQQRVPILNGEILKDKINYIMGNTWEEDKNEEKLKDKNYRRKLGIQVDYFRHKLGS